MTRRAWAFGALVTLIVGVGARADATPLVPRIDQIDPDEIVSGSPDTTVAITGDGFVAQKIGPARAESVVYGDGSPLAATVVDEQHITAVIPARRLEGTGWISVYIWNGVRRGGIFVPLVFSNGSRIDVVEPPPSSIRVDVDAPQSVGSCFPVYFVPINDDGGVSSSTGMTFTVTSDDVETPAPDDGGLVFHRDWCDGDTVNGPFTVDQHFPAPLWTESSDPKTVEIIVTTSDPPLHGTSGPVRIQGGYVAGRVVAAADGAPVAGVGVYLAYTFGFDVPLFRPRQNPSFPEKALKPRAVSAAPAGNPYLDDAISVTGSDGTFRSRAVAPGSYALYFLPPEGTWLAAEWSGDADDPASATQIEMRDGETSGVDASLDPGGTISGRISAADSGDALPDSIVDVVNPETGGVVAVTSTHEHGDYTTTGLRPRAYTLRFLPSDDAYLSTWFRDAPDGDHATSVPVVAGADAPGIDQALTRGASVAGFLRKAEDGQPLKGYVRLYDAAKAETVAWGFSDGTQPFHSAPGLPAGTYKLRISPFDTRHPSGWYQGAPTFARATPIELQTSEERRIDPTMPIGGAISGLVLGRSKVVSRVRIPQPAGATIRAYDSRSGTLVGFGFTDQTGHYDVVGLPEGRYKLRFEPHDSDLAPEWFDDAPDRASAQEVAVGPGHNVTANATLGPGGSIEGHLSDVDGKPARDAEVLAYRDGEDEPPERGYASEDGAFVIGGLAPGTYRVSAEPDYDERLEKPVSWYPDAATRALAKPVTVRRGKRATGVDFSFGRASFIGGRVTGVSDAGYLDVDFIDPESFELVATTWTDEDGTYRSEALHAGRYLVKVSGAYERAPEYYGGAPNALAATPVIVEPGDTLAGVDVELDGGRSIHGTIRAAHSAAPVANEAVDIVDGTTGESLGRGWSSGDGTYRSTPLKPGSYKVRFSRWWDGDIFDPQWYADRSSFDDADVVVVAIDVDTTGIDASLRLRE